MFGVSKEEQGPTGPRVEWVRKRVGGDGVSQWDLVTHGEDFVLNPE